MAYLKKQKKIFLYIDSDAPAFNTSHHKPQTETRYELLTVHHGDNPMECHTLFPIDIKK